MRILFMGTAELACPCLEAVAHQAGHEVVGVITQPDRPKGRNLKPSPPPVKVTAQRLGLPVHQPLKVRDAAAIELVRNCSPDLVIVVAYGQILPTPLLEIAPRGCVNVHASLLPRWRGASPIQHAILAGDDRSGVTTMYMNERMDAGDIILQKAERIRADDTGASLHDRLAKVGTDLLAETITLIACGKAPRQSQDETQVTYAHKLTKERGHVDWTRPAVAIERQVRAFDPWPGTCTFLGDSMLKLWRTEVVADAAAKPGEVLSGGVVATGVGGLRLVEVQPAGGRRMVFAAFAAGHEFLPGIVLK